MFKGVAIFWMDGLRSQQFETLVETIVCWHLPIHSSTALAPALLTCREGTSEPGDTAWPVLTPKALLLGCNDTPIPAGWGKL